MKGVIHWVSASHALPVEIRLYDRLFSVPNPAQQKTSGDHQPGIAGHQTGLR